MVNNDRHSRIKARQRGTSSVEFAIIAILFFTIFFSIIEFGRFFYLFNTVQEVTRCAARAAVVKWTGDWGGIPQQCLFNQIELVAGWEVGTANVRLRALNLAGNEAYPSNVGENIANCIADPADTNCIRFVQASVEVCANAVCQPIQYQPMFGLIPLQVGIPNSTVRMPAESLGYQI